MGSEGHALNLYVQKKLPKSYSNCVAQLQEWAGPAKASNSKVNTDKGLKAFQDISAFKLENFLLPEVLVGFNAENGKLLRLAFFLAAQMSENNDEISQTVTSSLMREISASSVSRRAAALKTFARVAPENAVNNSLLPAVSQILAGGLHTDTKKRGMFKFGGSGAVKGEHYMHIVALSCARQRLVNSKALFDIVYSHLNSPHPVAVRHAMSLLLDYASDMTHRVLQMQTHIKEMAQAHAPLGPGAPAPTGGSVNNDTGSQDGNSTQQYGSGGKPHYEINLEDNMARLYFVRICHSIAYSKSSDIQAEQRIDFYKGVVNSLADQSPMVVIEGIMKLSLGEWVSFHDRVVASIHGSEALIATINRKLEGYILGRCRPLQHAACRAALAICKCYMKYSERERQKLEGNRDPDPNPFEQLAGPLASILNHASPSVLTMAMRALVWLAPTDKFSTISEYIVTELQRNALTPEQFDEILQELHYRLLVSPSISGLLVKLTLQWFWMVPDKLNADLLVQTWAAAMQDKKELLKTIFSILDAPIPALHAASIQRVHRAVYYFIGENANFLCDEYPERYLQLKEDMLGKGKPATKPTPRRNLSSAVKVEPKEEEREVAVKPKSIPKTFDLYNPSMKACFMRLQHGVAFESAEIGEVCVLALAKLAFRSGDPLRFLIYEFLTEVGKENENEESLPNAVLVPILRLLDDIYKEQDAFIRRFGQTSHFSDEELRRLYELNEDLIRRIKLFCFVPPGFSALGPKCKEYLAEYWERFGAQER